MELDRALRAIDAIYETVHQAERWPGALTLIADAVGARSAALITRAKSGTLSAVTSPNISELLREYEAGWWKQDFLIQRAIEYSFATGVDAVRDAQIVAPEEWATHPFCNVFFRKYGLGTAMSASVSPAPNTIVRLAAQGALDRPPFTEAECKVLEQLARHCERALSLTCRASEQELIVRSVSEAIGRFGSAVFLLDHSGSVLWKNRASEELIGNGIGLAGGKLSAEHRADQAMLRAAIQSAVSSEIADKLECPKPVLLRRDGERRPAVAQLIPVRTTGTRQLWSPLQQSAAICLITDLEREAETDPALVRDCLGLTLGEARVATQISHGRSPRDAAETLQITEETVRTVLKKIFAKTGISRQSELAAMLSRLPVLGPAQPATDRPARLADRNPALTDPR